MHDSNSPARLLSTLLTCGLAVLIAVSAGACRGPSAGGTAADAVPATGPQGVAGEPSGGLRTAAVGSLGADEPAPERGAPAPAIEAPSLSPGDVAGWRAHVLPPAEESGWDAIAWIPTFADCVRAADGARRPLLLWIMNGHPLGCT